MITRLFGATAFCISLAAPALAQSDQTLADIRQELVVLNAEVQRLNRELSTTGAAGGAVSAGSLLDRVNAIELELQRLTGATEQLEFRIGRVVADGTNRIGDLEFRLCELEPGCDIGALGDTPLLGGDTGAQAPSAAPQPAPQPAANSPQLASQEQADFERAQEALASRDFRAAADQFAAFNQTYPGGPLAIEAEIGRGDALEGLGDVREGARAYLSAFTMAPEGRLAPQALFKLGAALGRLGQLQEACVTLAEVAVRFPGAPAIADAQAAMRNLACS